MTNPKISLIIPAYNEEKYIGDTLKHALKSSARMLEEIIVIDNASTDRTAEIARGFAGVRVVREEKKGLTRARQRGYLEARGDILAYNDADTRMPPGWCERVIGEFEKDPDLATLSGPYVYYDVSAFQNFLVWLYWYLLGWPVYRFVGFMVVGGNFAIRKSTLDKMKGFDTTIEFYGEDTNIARRAHEFGKVKWTPRLVMYTSGRRFAGQGLWRTAFLYMKNYAAEAFLKRPATKQYQDIR